MFEEKLNDLENVVRDLDLTEGQRNRLSNVLVDIRRAMPSANGHVEEINGRRVFIGMPHHMNVDADAMMRAMTDSVPNLGRKVADFVHESSSLLCHCFNSLWTTCLNDHQEADWWFLNHADVFSKDKYVWTMIDEAEAGGYDVLHAVVAIKDNFGATSTALGTMDPWNCPRRLTMSELDQCPETFTGEDMLRVMGREEVESHAPGPWFMMPNTGMLLVRLKKDGKPLEWVHKFTGFTIMDRIVRQEFELDDNGKFVDGSERYVELSEPYRGKGANFAFNLRAQVLSEDWNFGRYCHQNGLKVGGTKKITTFHAGQYIWSNRQIWGLWCQDEHWLERNRRQKVGRDLDARADPLFPYDVHGWLSVAEGGALRRWAKDKRVLEIGAYCGKSTICLAQSAVSVNSVDTFDGRGTPSPSETLAVFKGNLTKYGVEKKVTEHVGEVTKIIPIWPCYNDVPGAPKFGLVFVDGSHDLKSVRKDIQLALRVLADDGLIAFHDYGRPRDPDVTRAVDELGGEIVELLNDNETNSHMVLVRPKGV